MSDFKPEIVRLQSGAENQAKPILKDKLKVGIVGATGMVGQQLIRMLKDNPWFEITTLAASAGSAGKSYEQSVAGRWFMDFAIPENIGSISFNDCFACFRPCSVSFCLCAFSASSNSNSLELNKSSSLANLFSSPTRLQQTS